MRIVYGVMGYGRGHATRTATVLPDLMARHEVLILAGRDAYHALAPDFPVIRIPTLGYRYGRRGRRSLYLTAKENLPAVLDLMLRGPSLSMVMDIIRDFRADAIISDAEAWTQRAGHRLGVPRITFDHFGILTHCRPLLAPADRTRAARDRWAYMTLMGGQPERAIVSSFYDAPPRRPGVRVVGPLLRDEVRKIKPVRGDYLLAYFNQGAYQFTARVEQAVRGVGMPVKIYGTQRFGIDGNLEFRPPSNQPFLEDLARCRAVLSTAGNQLVGEAMYYGKPMLVMPEDCVEQRCNAMAIDQMGIGQQIAQQRLTTAIIEQFLAREDEFVQNIRRSVRDGHREALEALESHLAELSGQRKRPDFIRKVS